MKTTKLIIFILMMLSVRTIYAQSSNSNSNDGVDTKDTISEKYSNYMISFSHYNSIRSKSEISINFDQSFENKNTVGVYYKIDNKILYKQITKVEYEDIIKLVEKINTLDILKRNNLYVDASETKITISNLGSSVSYSLQGLNKLDHRKETLNFKNACISILSTVNLDLDD